jgi:hypothetical protein
MLQKLKEINDLYIQIQDNYPFLSSEHETTPINEEIKDQKNWLKEYERIYNIAIIQFRAIGPQLTPEQVLEGYTQGCKMLQQNLSGHMCYYFTEAYIPLMIQEIEKEAVHTAPQFLQCLSFQLGAKIAPIVLQALKSEKTPIRETALSIVDSLNIFEARLKVIEMTDDPEQGIASLAREIIKDWLVE